MRHIKKLASIMLALAMVFTMAVGAFASSDLEPETPAPTVAGPGTITVSNALYGETYSLYKIFDLSVSDDGNAYSYTLPVGSDFEDFFIGENAVGATYVTIDSSSRVVTAKAILTTDESSKYDFANALMAYIDGRNTDDNSDNNVEAIKTITETNGEGTYTLVFDELAFGYYLIDTSVAAVCILNSNVTDLNLTAKSPVPVIDKKVQEDSTGNWGATNTADIGDVVNFQSKVQHIAKLEKLVVHDTMSKGLTFDITSVKITINNEDSTPVEIIKGTDYNVTATPILEGTETVGTSITITFSDEFLKNRIPADELLITYSATLNESAVVGGNGNPNDIWHTYGNDQESEKQRTVTYTWPMGIEKYTNGATGEIKLEGAEFVVIKNLGSFSTADYVVCTFDENGQYNGWVRTSNDNPQEGEAAGIQLVTYNKESTTAQTRKYEVNRDLLPEECKLVSDKDGKINVHGLDSDRYIVKETAAPAGYNLKTTPDLVIITESGAMTTIDGQNIANNTIRVLNQTGTELPSTGGMGTTIFYVVGSILVVGAAVLMVTRRRMGKNI